MIIKTKKGAIELSIGTVVIIVLAMSMLILGLVLVKNIFSGAIGSVETLNDKVRSEIAELFTKENSKVVVRLGADRTAEVDAGESFGVAIGAKTQDNSNADQLEYYIELDDAQPGNCYNTIQATAANALIREQTETWIEFDEWDGATARAIITIDVPEATELCSQKVKVKVRDLAQDPAPYAQSFFIFEVQSGGFF